MTTTPTYVYKLVPSTTAIPLDSAALPAMLPVSSVDAQSGFVHLSTAAQVPGTLAHFFRSDAKVYVLRLPYAPLEAAGTIRWEAPEGAVCGARPGEGSFPHLYNGLRVGRAEVDSVWLLERGDGWAQAIADAAFQTWFVY